MPEHNILMENVGHVKGKDCSQLTVWQAALQGAEAQDATFFGADLTGSVFLEALDAIMSVALSATGQYVASGSILLAAVLFDRLKQRRRV